MQSIKSINALSARSHFGEIMQEAEDDRTRFLVNKRGKPKVVILSVDDYLKNIIKQPNILTEIQMSAKEANLDNMSMKEINQEISAVRNSKT